MTRLELAASILGLQPDQFIKTRETDDGGIVVIDPVGRKYVFSEQDLSLESARLTAQQALKAAKAIKNAIKPESIVDPAATPIAEASKPQQNEIAKSTDSGGPGHSTSVADLPSAKPKEIASRSGAQPKKIAKPAPPKKGK